MIYQYGSCESCRSFMALHVVIVEPQPLYERKLCAACAEKEVGRVRAARPPEGPPDHCSLYRKRCEASLPAPDPKET